MKKILFLLIVSSIIYSEGFGHNNSQITTGKIININQFTEHFVCPPPGGFTANERVTIRFYISESNKVELVEVISNNILLKSHCEGIFKSLPPKAFLPFHQVNGDTLSVPLKFSSCIHEEQSDDKKKKKK